MLPIPGAGQGPRLLLRELLLDELGTSQIRAADAYWGKNGPEFWSKSSAAS